MLEKNTVWDDMMKLKDAKVSGKEFESESFHLKLPKSLRNELEEAVHTMRKNGDKERLNDFIIKCIMQGLKMGINSDNEFYLLSKWERLNDYYKRTKKTATP